MWDFPHSFSACILWKETDFNGKDLKMKKKMKFLCGALIILVFLFGITTTVFADEKSLASSTQDVKKEESKKTNTSKTQSADEAFQEFLDSVSFIKNDETWNTYGSGFLGKLFNDKARTRADDFVNVVKNATEEDWFNMSQYDRFVYYESYVRVQKYINLGNWEKYFSSREKFHNEITSPVVELMNGTEGDSTVVSDAYLKLMDWQYDYVQEHKAAFDFITGKDYIENGGSKADLKQEQKDKEAKKEAEKKEIEQAQKEAGIQDDTLEKSGVFIILFILVLGCGTFLVYRKFKHDK